MKQYVFLVLSLFPFLSNSETLVLEYASFYSHVKKIDKEDTSALQFAFGFLNIRNKSLCNIKNAFINTQKKDIPLDVSEENRFTVPNEKALKMAKANVIVELEQPANICDMSVQLETKPEYLEKQYTQAQLVLLHNQYQEFFDNMGGFMSFLMPGTQGLVFHFDQAQSAQDLPVDVQVIDNKIQVSETVIDNTETLTFNTAPMRITAWMDK